MNTFTATDIVLIISALGIAIVNIVTAFRVKATAAKVDVIDRNVNGAHARALERTEALAKQVETLTALIAERKEIASLLAQDAAKRAEG